MTNKDGSWESMLPPLGIGCVAIGMEWFKHIGHCRPDAAGTDDDPLFESDLTAIAVLADILVDCNPLVPDSPPAAIRTYESLAAVLRGSPEQMHQAVELLQRLGIIEFECKTCYDVEGNAHQNCLVIHPVANRLAEISDPKTPAPYPRYRPGHNPDDARRHGPEEKARRRRSRRRRG